MAYLIPDRVTARVASKYAIHEGPSPYPDVEGPCWISGYSVASHGYAQIGWHEEGKRYCTTAHRVIWAAAHGPIPDGMTIDHLCKQRRCVNLAHLRMLSNYENARRTRGRDWPLGECINGHPNSMLHRQRGGKVVCKPCLQASRDRWTEKNLTP